MYICVHAKCHLFLSEFNQNLILSAYIRKIVIKFRPVGDELFHADGQTDMTKLVVTFRNFVSAPKTSDNVTPCPEAIKTRQKMT